MRSVLSALKVVSGSTGSRFATASATTRRFTWIASDGANVFTFVSFAAWPTGAVTSDFEAATTVVAGALGAAGAAGSGAGALAIAHGGAGSARTLGRSLHPAD